MGKNRKFVHAEPGWIVLIAWVLALVSAAIPASGLEFQVKTAKSTYYQGELLEVLVIATNPQPTDVVLGFSSSHQASYTMDSYTPHGGVFAIVTSVTVPAGGTYTWRFVHDWSGYKPGLGTHTLAGTVVGYGSSTVPLNFTVLPSPAPQTNASLDFDQIPGTDAPVGSLIAYEALGVKFSSFAGGLIAFQGPATNRYLGAVRCNYPTGFNLVANFDLPVYGVNVEVSGGVGKRITMLALDATGVVLAATTSPPTPDDRRFTPLSLHLGHPISSIQFWPDYANSSVNIENLLLELTPSQPDPSSALHAELIPGGLRLTWPPDLTYTGLEMSPNLLPGSWQFVQGSDLTNSLFTPVNSSPAFFRIRPPVGSTTLK